MKTKLLIAAVMFFGLSVAAFAQATYTVGSTPVTTVVDSGITEKTGDITFTTVSTGGPTVTGTITIEYGVDITYLPPGAVIVSAGGPTITAQGPPLSGNMSSIVLTISADNTVPDYNFRLTGVRVRIAGTTNAVPLNADITSVGNAIVAGQTYPRVIQSARPGIHQCVSTGIQINDMSGAITGGTNPVDIRVDEEFRNAFGITNASDATQDTPQRIKIWLNPAPPSGITVTFPATDSSGKWALLSHTATTAYYGVVVDSDLTALENLHFYVTVASNLPLHTRYPVTDVIAFVSLATIEEEALPLLPIVRYVEAPVVCPIPIVSIFHQPNFSTTLLVPYAVNQASVAGMNNFDTGLAIANTTSDPGFSNMHFYGAQSQNGTFKFYLYTIDATTGNPVLYTADSPALDPKGILSSGVLAAGKTYTIMLSEVLTAAAAPQDFSGYIFIVTQFTNAHGEYFISDYYTFTHGALMLQVAGDRDMGTDPLDN